MVDRLSGLTETKKLYYQSRFEDEDTTDKSADKE